MKNSSSQDPNGPDTRHNEPAFHMPWTDDARELLALMPKSIVATAIKNAESFAQESGYEQVSRSSMAELMKKMGMDLDALLVSCPYAVRGQKNKE